VVVPDAYRELPPPPGTEAHVACLWVSHDRAVRVLPDACADVVFSDGHLIVAGPATTASTALATPGRPRVGVRFRVGSAGPALGVAASELLDLGAPLTELWGPSARRLEDRVALAPTPAAALDALVRGLAERLPRPGEGDRLIRAAVQLLRRDSPYADRATERGIAAVARQVGLGERQLRRRFERAVGYGPSTFVRVHRFQRFLALANEAPHAPLARLAADAGYADQAHLTRETRRLAGLPASRLLAEGAWPAGEKSDAFKRVPAAPGRLAA
jgi:AraC-like DNA-binding protein